MWLNRGGPRMDGGPGKVACSGVGVVGGVVARQPGADFGRSRAAADACGRASSGPAAREVVRRKGEVARGLVPVGDFRLTGRWLVKHRAAFCQSKVVGWVGIWGASLGLYEVWKLGCRV